MSEIHTVELPDELARQARALAAATNRPFQEAVVEWISRAVAEPIVESQRGTVRVNDQSCRSD